MTRQIHGRGQHWQPVGDEVEHIVQLMGETDHLAEIAIASTQSLLKLAGWNGEVVRSSDIAARPERSLRLVDLTLAVDATDYLCGTGGARYLDTEAFDDQGLGVSYFNPPEASAWRGATRVSAIAALAEDGKLPPRAPREVTRLPCSRR